MDGDGFSIAIRSVHVIRQKEIANYNFYMIMHVRLYVVQVDCGQGCGNTGKCGGNSLIMYHEIIQVLP